MPTPLPTSFASAAASNGTSDNNSRAGAGSDWGRSRPNGATQTFRRPSQANSSSHLRENSQNATPTSTAGIYIPPHLNANHQSRTTVGLDSRYTKSQLLELLRAVPTSRGAADMILNEGWTPGSSSVLGHTSWSRREDPRESTGPEVCWDESGVIQPLGMIEMTEEEKELFNSSVNSTVKAPAQNKDGTPQTSLNGPKATISQTQANAGRTGARRRDTNESFIGNNPLASPTAFGRNFKEEATPPSLTRRRTEKEGALGPSLLDRTKTTDAQGEPSSPFGSFKRSVTGPMSAGLNGPTSPWTTGPQSAGFGAFGNFSLEGMSGQPSTPGERKVGFGSLRGESRFKGLMSRESNEDMTAKLRNKASTGSLEELPESDPESSVLRWSSNRAAGPGTKGLADSNDAERVGSAALGGEDVNSPFHSSYQPRPQNDIGFADLNSDMSALREAGSRREFSSSQGHTGNLFPTTSNEPMSPTGTNPYQSPEGDNVSRDDDTDTTDPTAQYQGGYGASGQSSKPFNPTFDSLSGDQSRTSSAGPSRGFPPLSTLGSLGSLAGGGAWSASGVPSSSQRPSAGPSAFNDSFFGSFHESQLSPSGFGSNTNYGNIGAIGSRSKMGSLFQTSIHEQQKPLDSPRFEKTYGEIGGRMSAASSTAPAPGYPMPPRDTDSPSRQPRGVLDDLFGNLEARGWPAQGQVGAYNPQDAQNTPQLPQTESSTPSGPESSAPGFTTRSPDPGTEIPASQQRTMVMPDRMRWIYRDPQGNTQGPWNGLEMHDWYKAGFFTAELQVKKLEDSDFEPLAQLIRRIGNSREPFLVPQIGIPHGPPTSMGSGPTGATGGPPTSQGAQPPFASVFPTFGTTLTAEQQNALERRKQEEQYLMARQKEHLHQHQMMMRQQGQFPSGPHAIHPQQLHHHSSAHSLQSQPSFSSMTSPMAFHPSPAHGPAHPPGSTPGFFDPSARYPAMGFSPEADLNSPFSNLNINRTGPSPYGQSQSGAAQAQSMGHPDQVNTMLQDRQRLQKQQEELELMQRAQPSDSNEGLERLRQFQTYQGQEAGRAELNALNKVQEEDEPIRQPLSRFGQESLVEDTAPSGQDGRQLAEPRAVGGQTALAQVSNATVSTAQPSAWSTIESGLPAAFPPPPPSTSPLPAPAAQRSRSNVIETIVAESRSRSQTPSVETPTSSLAPWAKENIEAARGPSLREIQEAEAREAAHLEELAAQQRRAIAEQERVNQAQAQATASAPGLPSSANWANNGSPLAPTAGTSSVWGKAPAAKPAVPNVGGTGSSQAKKSLAQIQKEEEARKRRAATSAGAAVIASGPAPKGPGGKLYSEFAAVKAVPPSQALPGGPWSTVGKDGKAKVTAPTASTVTAKPTVAATSSATQAKKPATPSRSTTGNVATQAANEEFMKWVKGTLGKGLKSGINVDNFVASLLQLPLEPEILSDSVYGSSDTLDGRRIAEEFIRRRKLADKGVIPEKTASPGNAGDGKSGGWSEVAKKGPSNASTAKEEANSAFKVVAAKKKGKK